MLCFGAMGWWCAPLMLVLVLWLPRNPDTWAGGLGLWWWVALVSWLPGVHPCLLCFLAPTDQRQLCRYITGTSAKDTQHQLCLEALVKAAEPLASVTVGASWEPQGHPTQQGLCPRTLVLTATFIPPETPIPRWTPTLNRTPEPSVFPTSTKALTLTLAKIPGS